MKSGKVKEITDIRDETDLQGLKITIDYRKSQDPHKLMLKLFKSTPLEDSFGCNFNILIEKRPMVLGVIDIIKHWVDFRRDTLTRKSAFEIGKQNTKLNLLLGLKSILVDIDRVIKIIRGTETEKEVIPTLKNVFSLNDDQAEYISEIRLRNLNKEYILKRLDEINTLEIEIEKGTKILQSEKLQNKDIVTELKNISKKYGNERKTTIADLEKAVFYDEVEEEDNSLFHIFVTKDGYFKKITDISLKRSSEQKIKDDDEILDSFSAKNQEILWVLTDQSNLYQLKLSEMEEMRSSQLGIYLPNQLNFEKNENIIRVLNPSENYNMIINVYANGKVAKVDINAYATKGFRKKLQNIYSDKSEIVDMIPAKEDQELALLLDNDTYIRFNTDLINLVGSRGSQGVQVARINKTSEVIKAIHKEIDMELYKEGTIKIPKAPKKINYNQIEV